MIKKILFLLTLSFSYLHAKEYPRPIPGYFSQNGQDQFLNKKIFKGKKFGWFVEVGAHDGISFSNTYFFEKYLGWQGICIEPNPDIFNKLIKNRKALCLPIGIANNNTILKFLKGSGYMIEMYSGILDSMDERHLQRIENEIKEFGGDSVIIEVECRKLQDIFDQYNINHIDFISIDIEGGEEEAVKSIDFSKVTIDIIIVENNFHNTNVRKYLTAVGYTYINKIGKDDIFLRKGFMYD